MSADQPPPPTAKARFLLVFSRQRPPDFSSTKSRLSLETDDRWQVSDGTEHPAYMVSVLWGNYYKMHRQTPRDPTERHLGLG